MLQCTGDWVQYIPTSDGLTFTTAGEQQLNMTVEQHLPPKVKTVTQQTTL